MPEHPQVGLATGLAIYGANIGMIVEVEVTATRAKPGKGTIRLTGIVEEEEVGGGSRTFEERVWQGIRWKMCSPFYEELKLIPIIIICMSIFQGDSDGRTLSWDYNRYGNLFGD